MPVRVVDQFQEQVMQDAVPDNSPARGNLPAPLAAQPQLGLAMDPRMQALSTSCAADADGDQEGQLDLLKYWHVIVKRKWTVLGIVIVLLTGMMMTMLTTPIYRATATVQIERQAIPCGQRARRGSDRSHLRLRVLRDPVPVAAQPLDGGEGRCGTGSGRSGFRRHECPVAGVKKLMQMVLGFGQAQDRKVDPGSVAGSTWSTWCAMA
jgi:hypothetical protein